MMSTKMATRENPCTEVFTWARLDAEHVSVWWRNKVCVAPVLSQGLNMTMNGPVAEIAGVAHGVTSLAACRRRTRHRTCEEELT